MLFSPPLNLTEKEFVDKYNELYKKSDFEEKAIPFSSIAIAFGIIQSCDNTGYLEDEVGKFGMSVLILLLCFLILLLNKKQNPLCITLVWLLLLLLSCFNHVRLCVTP